jgi:SHS2 domain-containing protein
MGDFEILPHTADVGFRARGADLDDLFQTAALAMFSLEYDPASVPLEASVDVTAGGDDLESALFGWLAELIWVHDADGFVPGAVSASVRAAEGGGVAVEGSARGATLGDWFVPAGPQLKAVTLYGLQVGPAGEGYEATVYLDV